MRPNTRQMNGVISRIEEDAIIYIWAAEFPTSELLFLNNTNDATFRPGAFVNFQLSGDNDVTQVKVEEPPQNLVIIYPEPGQFRFSVQIGIPPHSSSFFHKDLVAALDFQVCFFCYSPVFGKIASFIALEHAAGKFYNVLIGRIPTENDWLIPKIGTMLALEGAQTMTEITDPAEIQGLAALMPWNAPMPLLPPTSNEMNSLI